MSCSFFEDKGSFGFRPYCLKKDDYIDTDVYDDYCSGYHYDDCPIYQGGSSSGGCYLTSACVFAKGLPDNCYELETLRHFRDGWLALQEGGKELIQRYYQVAPKIVSTINDRSDRREIYDRIYETLVAPCVKLIEAGKNQETMQLYRKVTEDLEAQYCGA
jgi:hypothetical protein